MPEIRVSEVTTPMRKWSRTTLKAGLPSVPAVYVVIRNDDTKNRRPLYVGQTKDLRERFKQHHMQFRKLHHRSIVVFSVRRELFERAALEQKLIHRLNPIGNTHRNTLRQALSSR